MKVRHWGDVDEDGFRIAARIAKVARETGHIRYNIFSAGPYKCATRISERSVSGLYGFRVAYCVTASSANRSSTLECQVASRVSTRGFSFQVSRHRLGTHLGHCCLALSTSECCMPPGFGNKCKPTLLQSKGCGILAASPIIHSSEMSDRRDSSSA